MGSRHKAQIVVLAVVAALSAGCQRPLDIDLRQASGALDTTDAAASVSVGGLPTPDSRGIISYSDYQVAVARPGDTLPDVAGRVGLPAEELAAYNGLPLNAELRRGEIVALPRRVAIAGPVGTSAAGEVSTAPLGSPGTVDIASIAGPAIERAAPGPSASPAPTGTDPVRHRVQSGETAFSIARRYGTSVEALAEWNSLGPERTVRVGQFLLIPPASATARTAPVTTRPGQGTLAPAPPSAAEPLPEERPAAPVAVPSAPELAEQATTASDTARFVTPVSGRIVRDYSKGTNDGIDISAAAGAPVRAADAGTVAAVTRDTDGVPIVVIRHGGDLLSVYAGVDDLKVAKGDTVGRGQTIANVRGGSSPVFHFEVRQGFESVDPSTYLQ